MTSSLLGGIQTPPLPLKWWRHLWTAPKYEMSLRPTHLSERRMLRTWGSWKLHWRRLSRRERFSWKRGQSFRRDNVEDIKRFKIVRDAIADQFCIFFNIDKKAVTTEIDKIRRTLWKPTNIPLNLDKSIFTTTREKTGKSSSYYSSFSSPNSSTSRSSPRDLDCVGCPQSAKAAQRRRKNLEKLRRRWLMVMV